MPSIICFTHMPLIVQEFGETSVTVTQMILGAAQAGNQVVVVSAMEKTTAHLVALAKELTEGKIVIAAGFCKQLRGKTVNGYKSNLQPFAVQYHETDTFTRFMQGR